MACPKTDNLRYQVNKTRAFYNQKQKEDYIDYIKEKGASIEEGIRTERMFEILRKTEDILDRDASGFSREEAAEAFGRFCDIKQTQYTLLNRIRKYVKWCRKTGVQGVGNGFFEFTPEKENYKPSKVANPRGLEIILNDIRRIDGEGSLYGPHFRLCVWLMYAGATIDLLDHFDAEGVSVPDLAVSFEGSARLVLEPESVGDLIAVLKGEHGGEYDLLPSGAEYLQLPSHWYLRMAKDAESRTHFDFSPQNVLICGMFYRMWKRETLESRRLIFSDLAEEARRKGILFRGRGDIALEFKEQYERWKCAFQLT